MTALALFQLTVVYSPAPRCVQEISLQLPQGSTVASAVAASGFLRQIPDDGGDPIDPAAVLVGVWGHKASPGQLLRDGDRVEIYRGLKVDPKVARRERFVKQGAKKAGLFATRRPGAKPGY